MSTATAAARRRTRTTTPSETKTDATEAVGPSRRLGALRLATLVVARSLVVVFGYALVMVCAQAVIPSLAAFLLRSSKLSVDSSWQTTAALWLVPLGFLALVLGLCCFSLLRWLWNAAPKLVGWAAGPRPSRTIDDDPTSSSKPAAPERKNR